MAANPLSAQERVRCARADAEARRRRAVAPKPPMGLATSYASALRRALAHQQALVLDVALRSYRPKVREDAAGSGDGTSTMRELSALHIEAPIATLELVAHRVGRAVDLETRRALGAVVGQRVPGISRGSQGIRAAEVQAFRRENVDLIKSIERDQLDDVMGVLDEATEAGWTTRELSGRLRERFGVSRSRATLIAVDQTLKLNGQLTKARQQSAGIEKYKWVSSNDERVRDDHAALDGQTFSWDDPPIVDAASGRRGHPGEDFRCRCTASAVVPFLEGGDDEGGE